MKLTKINVLNFKRVKKVELVLADLNILVGGNGSGKSSIIQAIHLACCVMRQAPSVETQKTSTIGIEELDYLPTNNYKQLGHKAYWGNTDGSASSKLEMTFEKDNVNHVADCT